MRLQVFISLCLLILAGCSENLSEQNLELSENDIQCPSEGGKFEIETAGRPDWVTDNTADWISIRRSYGKATVHIKKNHGHKRTHTINFKAGERILTGLTISQDNSESIFLDSDLIESGYKGGEFHVCLTCFEQWSVHTESDWISASPMQGNGPEEMTISIQSNSSKSGRQCDLVIRNESKTLTLTVVQSPMPYIEVEKDECTFDGDGGYSDILYMSNTDVCIVSNNDWIRKIETDGNIRKVSIEVLRNLGTERKGSVTISSETDPEISREIIIKQGAKIDHPRLSIAEGSVLTLESKAPVTLHPVFEDMSDTAVVWNSSDPSVAEIDNEGNVTIHTGGVCTMTARNIFHSLEAAITLRIMPKAESMAIYVGQQNMSETSVAVRYQGEKNELNVVMSPDDAYSDDVVYFSADPDIAEIIGNTLHCLSPGKTVISAESPYQKLRTEFMLVVLE